MANLQAYTIDQKEWRGEELDEEQAELDANIAILLYSSVGGSIGILSAWIYGFMCCLQPKHILMLFLLTGIRR